MYEEFLNIFSKIYDKHFPLLDVEVKVKDIKIDVEVKVKDIKIPMMSKGLKKSSRRKQKLYIKF